MIFQTYFSTDLYNVTVTEVDDLFVYLKSENLMQMPWNEIGKDIVFFCDFPIKIGNEVFAVALKSQYLSSNILISPWSEILI